jgi:signal transduction histidine kinase
VGLGKRAAGRTRGGENMTMSMNAEARRNGPVAPAPWTVLVVFLLITALATKYVWDSSRLADRTRFTSATQTTRDTIRFRIETYVNVLRAATGLFAANHAATRDDFRAYVRHLDVQRRYPGVLGIGLSLRVRPEDVERVVGDMRANEAPDFDIWPEMPRPEYHTVVVIEPFDQRNRSALGYDLHTSPKRREAMDRARDSAEATATARITLIPEVDPKQSPGFVIFLPVYNVPVTPPSVEERRNQLYGFVYAPFRATDLFNATIGAQVRPEVRFLIDDGAELLYDSDPHYTGSPRFTSATTFRIAGRTWSIRFESERTGIGAPFWVAAATLIGGLAISFLLFAVLRLQSRGRQNAERVAERLRRSEAELQRANLAKDEFLATLSHELRTPMTAILGWSALLAGELDPQTRATAIDAIQKSGRAQAQLIDDLLDVSRITAGKMRIDPKPVDIKPIVSTAVEAVMPVAEAKGVTIRKDLGGAPMVVNGDGGRLQQVVWNLMTNAVKFTPAGGSVDVRLRSDGLAELTVADTGPGIDPDFLPHVFERFRQADSSTTRAFTGLGLGLAIVHHLVELHGGTVVAESDGLGKGARFIVRLPLISSGAAAVTPADDARGRASLHGVEILVVDDDASVRQYASTVLRMSGATVRSVSSANEALQSIAEALPDVVITDIGMPDMDGYDLLREIRDSSNPRMASLPVIALTAYARTDDRELIEQAGFDGLLTKPVEPEPLRAAVAGRLVKI